MTATEPRHCDECYSPFRREASAMEGLCPECAHWLYGYPRCAHEMVEGNCRHCGWDGSVSAFVRSQRLQR